MFSSPTMYFTRCVRGMGGGEMNGEGKSGKTVNSSRSSRGPGTGVEDDRLGALGATQAALVPGVLTLLVRGGHLTCQVARYERRGRCKCVCQGRWVVEGVGRAGTGRRCWKWR